MPVPEKIKSLSNTIEAFATPNQDTVYPCPAGSGQEVGGKDGRTH